MRFRELLIVAGLTSLEIVLIALRFGVTLDAIVFLVQIATLATLGFTVYSWERGRLDKGYLLVEELRIWPKYFCNMTMHLRAAHPSQIRTQDEADKLTDLATETADNLSRALARSESIIGSDLAVSVQKLILELRQFVAKRYQPDKAEYLLTDLDKLRFTAEQIPEKVGYEEETRFKVRHQVLWPPIVPLVWVAFIVCSIVLLFVWLLW